MKQLDKDGDGVIDFMEFVNGFSAHIINSISDKKSSGKEPIIELDTENEDMLVIQRKLQEVVGENDKLQAKIVALKTHIESVEQNNEVLQEKLATATKKLDQNYDELRDFDSEKQALIQQVEKWQKEIEQSHENEDELYKRIKSLSTTKIELSGQISTKQEALQQMQEEIFRLRDKLRSADSFVTVNKKLKSDLKKIIRRKIEIRR